MITRIADWIGNIYNAHGWIAALVTLVVLVALAIGVIWLFGWQDQIGVWLLQLG